jgi:hypothetical protein
MSDTGQKDSSELSRQVSERQARTFVELIIDVLNALENHNQHSVGSDPQTADGRPPVLKGKENSVTSQSRVRRLLMLALAPVLFLNAQFSVGQSINEQKKAVVFIFGTIHPLNPDKTAITNTDGNQVGVEIPLGTGFFVDYPDQRPGCEIVYLVTAKHVLQDADGAFLPSVRIRMNLRSPVGDAQFGFISDIPVTDPQGNLLWFHSQNQAEDVVALPLLPDEREFEFTAIPTTMFLSDRTLNSGAAAEGDELYFIGLMEQYYGAKRNYPLVRRGTLALLTDEDIDTPTGRQKVLIAELESWPGNSGAPVFLLGGRRDSAPAAGNTVEFLGIIVPVF